MSALLMGRAFYADLPGNLKLVLIALADHANDDGTGIHVGQARLAAKCSVSTRTMRASLARLRDLGYITRVRRGRGPGRGHDGELGSPDVYQLNVEMLPQIAPANPAGANGSPEKTPEVGDKTAEAGFRLTISRTTSTTPPEISLASLARSLPPRAARGGERAPMQRPPDPIWEELFLVEAGEPYSPEARRRLTRKAAASLNTAAAEIRATGISAEELRRAIAAWPRVMGDATCTAHAIAKHLPRLLAAARGVVLRGPPAGSIAAAVAEAAAILGSGVGAGRWEEDGG
jgi:hypothetical protein